MFLEGRHHGGRPPGPGRRRRHASSISTYCRYMTYECPSSAVGDRPWNCAGLEDCPTAVVRPSRPGATKDAGNRAAPDTAADPSPVGLPASSTRRKALIPQPLFYMYVQDVQIGSMQRQAPVGVVQSRSDAGKQGIVCRATQTSQTTGRFNERGNREPKVPIFDRRDIT